jgi:hypothetical protein
MTQTTGTLTKEKKIDTKKINVITPHFDEKIKMTIDPRAMAHILDRLTDLYPKPLMSSIRELISNALDATVIMPADQQQAIEITRPSPFSLIFAVEDFGIGMSLEDVRNIYSLYGASTKRENFEQVGAFGLGAKAPLAYCSEFTGITTQNGITTEFTVTKNQKGNFVNILSTVETNRPSGTKIIMPIRESDVHEANNTIDTFSKYAFASPVNININKDGTQETAVVNSGNWLHFEDIVINDVPEIVVSAWIPLDGKDIKDFCNFIVGKSKLVDRYNLISILSGWGYKMPDQRDYWRSSNNSEIIFELRPGLVDFSSSRDEVVKNARSEELTTRVFAQLNEKLESKFWEWYANKASDIFATELFNVNFNRQATEKREDGVVVFGHSGGYSNSTTYELTVDQLTTTTGYNPFNFFYSKDSRSIYNNFLYISKETYRKTSNVAVVSIEDVTTINGHILNHNYLNVKAWGHQKDKISDSIMTSQKININQIPFGPEFNCPVTIIYGVNKSTVDVALKSRVNFTSVFDGQKQKIMFAKSKIEAVELKEVLVSKTGADNIEIMEIKDFEARAVEIAKERRDEARANRTAVTGNMGDYFKAQTHDDVRRMVKCFDGYRWLDNRLSRRAILEEIENGTPKRNINGEFEPCTECIVVLCSKYENINSIIGIVEEMFARGMSMDSRILTIGHKLTFNDWQNITEGTGNIIVTKNMFGDLPKNTQGLLADYVVEDHEVTRNSFDYFNIGSTIIDEYKKGDFRTLVNKFNELEIEIPFGIEEFISRPTSDVTISALRNLNFKHLLSDQENQLLDFTKELYSNALLSNLMDASRVNLSEQDADVKAWLKTGWEMLINKAKNNIANR